MKTLLAALVFVLAASPAYALCVQGIQSTPTAIHLNLGGEIATLNFADLKGGSRIQQAAQIQEILQGWIDVRHLLAEFVPDDPDKYTNPKRPDRFFADADGIAVDNDLYAIYIVDRCAIVTDVWWDGVTYSVSLSNP